MLVIKEKTKKNNDKYQNSNYDKKQLIRIYFDLVNNTKRRSFLTIIFMMKN